MARKKSGNTTKKRIMPVYLEDWKIKEIQSYAIKKGLRGQSQVVDLATEWYFSKNQ